MNEKKINARFIPKGDIEANWRKALGFIPHDKEIIVYKPDENNEKARLKIGDGVSGVNELPFAISQPDYLQNNVNADDYIKNKPFYSEGEKTEVIVDKTIIASQKLIFSKIDDGKIMSSSIDLPENTPLAVGAQYVLSIDGVDNLITLTTDSRIKDGLVFGNLDMLSDYHAGGQNFCGAILNYPDRPMLALILKTAVVKHTIGFFHAGNTAPIIIDQPYSFKDSEPLNGSSVFYHMWPGLGSLINKDTTYNVTFNGQTYTNITCSSWSQTLFLGNLSIGGVGTDTEENFLAFSTDGALIIMTNLPSNNYKLSIEAVLPTTIITSEAIHKIDPKFLPNAVQADYLQDDPTKEDYIKNRPFHSKITYDRTIIPQGVFNFEVGNSSNGIPLGWSAMSLDDEVCWLAMSDDGEYELTIDTNTYTIKPTLLGYLYDVIPMFGFGNVSILDSSISTKSEDENYTGVFLHKGDSLLFMLYYKSTEPEHKVGLSYIDNSVPLIKDRVVSFEKQYLPEFNCTLSAYTWKNRALTMAPNFVTDIYNVVINGEKFEELTWQGKMFLGNLALLGIEGLEDTGENFLGMLATGTDQADFIFITTLEPGEYSLSFEKASVAFNEEILQIEKKFLDVPYTEDKKRNVTFAGDITTANGNSLDTLKSSIERITADLDLQADYNQTDSSARDYIKNKPFDVNADDAAFKGTLSAEGIILDSTEKVPQNYIVLRDIEDGFRYALQMKGGNLVTKQLPIAIQVVTPPNKTTYYRGDYFDPSGMCLAAIYNDGTTELIENYAIPYINESFDTLGETNVTLRAKVFAPYETIFTVNVIEFEPEAVLTDFNYVENKDGTYTPTSWNRTLNGVNSTEFIVPNNSLIKI
jgi:hypothetical protein